MKKIKLFCFPYAGGSTNIYKRWDRYLESVIEICPIELSGRGTRYDERLCSSLSETIDDICEKIMAKSCKEDFAFYGHSMGCVLAYELYYKMRKKGYQTPIHIFFSGRSAPHIKDDRIIHNLPDEEFKQEIMDLGGTPEQIFKNKELLNIFLPILRADYKIVEEYKYVKKNSKINCNITVFGGTEEKFTKQNIEEWEKHTKGKCDFYILEGDHFFIHEKEREIVGIINNVLKNKY